MSKKKKIFLTASVLLIICIIGFFMFTYPGKALRDVTMILLDGNKVDINGKFEELKDLDEELGKYDVYLTGENHGTQLSYEMQKYMSKYFIENQGVKYIILELSPEVAELLNDYLETGDSKDLERIVRGFNGSFSYNQDIYDLFEFYCEYNKQLTEDKKIRFIGIDINHQMQFVSMYINKLVAKLGEPPKVIEMSLRKLNGGSWIYDNKFRAELKQCLIDNEDQYKEYFKEDYFYFNITMRNVLSNFNNTEREAAMVQNFNEFYEKLGEGKYYGQLGGAHVYKRMRTEYNDGEDPISTFANSINNDYESLNGKVYSIMYYYMNSYMNYSGDAQEIGLINWPYFKSDGEVRLYDPKKNKRTCEAFNECGVEEEMLGDIFFLLKDSKASPNFKGE